MHMLVLIAIGGSLLKSLEDRTVASVKIQTAGYLHTLIGFTAALLNISQINAEQFSFIPLLAPLGSALITSILGWFVGGELGAQPTVSSATAIQTDISMVQENLRLFATEITAIHHSYIQSVRQTADEMTSLHQRYQQLHDQQHDALQDAQEVATKLHKQLEPMATFMSPMTEAVEQFSTTLAIATKQINTHLSQSFLRDFEQTLQHTQAIQTNLANLVEGFRELSTIINEAQFYLKNTTLSENLKSLTQSTNMIAQQFQYLATSVNVVESSMTAVSKHVNTKWSEDVLKTLSRLESKGREIEQALTQVVTQFQDVTHHSIKVK